MSMKAKLHLEARVGPEGPQILFLVSANSQAFQAALPLVPQSDFYVKALSPPPLGTQVLRVEEWARDHGLELGHWTAPDEEHIQVVLKPCN